MASVGESLRPEPLQKEEVKSADKARGAAGGAREASRDGHFDPLGPTGW